MQQIAHRIGPWTVACAALFATCDVRPAAGEASQQFEKVVRPLLARKCFECHSSKAEELQGNLKLETVEQILQGGDNGPAVIPGDVKNSFLLRAIRYQEEDYQMPPSGRLSDEDIAAVEAWVKALQRDDRR